jgi:MFS family permease
MVAAAVATPLVPRIGTRPVIVAGALVAAGGLFHLSHVSADGTFLGDLLPGVVLVALGAGCVFTGTTTAATEGVPDREAGIASGLLNASMQFGGALGLAALSAVSDDRTHAILAEGVSPAVALAGGFQRAFLVGAGLLLSAALVALVGGTRRARERSSHLPGLSVPTPES